jgi:hypothetical protein
MADVRTQWRLLHMSNTVAAAKCGLSAVGLPKERVCERLPHFWVPGNDHKRGCARAGKADLAAGASRVGWLSRTGQMTVFALASYAGRGWIALSRAVGNFQLHSH